MKSVNFTIRLEPALAKALETVSRESRKSRSDIVRDALRDFARTRAKRSNPVDALRKIARKGGVGIKDPVAWQRAERRDRRLPGRAS